MREFDDLNKLNKAIQKNDVDKDEMVKVDGEEMKAGRGWVNSMLPEGYNFESRIDSSELKSTLQDISEEHPDRTSEIMDNLRQAGEEYVYERGFSVGLDDIELLEGRDEIVENAQEDVEKADSRQDMDEIVDKYTSQIGDQLGEQLKDDRNNFYEMVRAGSRGSMDQLQQMLGTPLILEDHKNRPVPSVVESSYAEGLNMGDYYTSLFGARKGVIDRRLATAKPGEISKNLIKSVDDQVISIDDCETTESVERSVNGEKAIGHILQENIPGVASKGDLVNSNILSEAERNGHDKVKVRTPIVCEAKKGVCKKCFGTNEFGKMPEEGENVGVKASQSLGRIVQQLTMDCTEGLVYNEETGFISYRDLYNSDKVSHNEFLENETWTKYTNGLKIHDNGEKVETASIQKHYPHDEMWFIRTESGKTLVAQGDHPIWVNKNEVKEVSNLEKGEDKLSIDNSILNKNGEEKCPYNPFEIGASLAIGEQNEAVNGKNKYKRLVPGFDKWKTKDLKNILKTYIKRKDVQDGKIKESSYILAQQLNIISSKIEVNLVISVDGKNRSPIFNLSFPDSSDDDLDDGDLNFNINKSNILKENYLDKVVCKQQIGNWKREVWDIKTESCGYNTGAIRNHNSFHTGGAAGAGSDVVSGLPRIKQLLEMPNDMSFEATISEKSGKVKDIKDREGGGKEITVEDEDGNQVNHFAPQDRETLVEPGDQVYRADKLTQGIPNPKKMAKTVGVKETRERLSDELEDSYEGFNINKKMFDTVVRGVTDLVRVKDPGDNDDYVPGDYASYSDVHAKNQEKATKKPVDDAIGDKVTEEYNTKWGLIREGDTLDEEKAQYLKEDNIQEVKTAKDPIEFRPKMAGINSISRYKPDSLAQMGFNRIKDAVKGSVAKGTESDIHGYDPIPAFAYGAEFGQGNLPGSY